jgi:phthalate 4,5-cis-dihydrodiol dehydrogenase
MAARLTPPIRFGIVGLGTAGTALIPPAVRHPGFTLAAAADLDTGSLAAFKKDFPDAETHTSVESIAASTGVDALFIATPTQHHVGHVLTALRAGKHVVTEKPIATTIADAQAMIAAAGEAGVTLMVGHSFGYETPIQEMARIVRSGELGPVQMVHNWYYTDWLYRPRNPEELDTALGGGVTFRQGSHQFDIIRLLCGGKVRSVRASTQRWDPARPTEGAHTVFLDFESGAVATAVYSGYDRFLSAELGYAVGENGKPVATNKYGAARAALGSRTPEQENELKRSLRYGGERNRGVSLDYPPHLPFYGITVVSCERGDVRQSPDGLLVYGPDGRREVTFPKESSGRDHILEELYAAVVDGTPPLHDGAWGLANLEVALAALESSRERREVFLKHQKAVE